MLEDYLGSKHVFKIKQGLWMNTETILCAASQHENAYNYTHPVSVSEDPPSNLFAKIFCGCEEEFAIISCGFCLHPEEDKITAIKLQK